MVGGEICSTAECGREVSARGFCLKCYKRLRRSGDLAKIPRAAGCKIQGCARKHKARGLCKAHYSAQLLREAGDCVIDGCAGSAQVRRLCTTHYRDWKLAQGSRCSVAQCDEPRHARALCRRHSRHERGGGVPRATTPCSRCGGPVDLMERTASGRRRYSSTKTCSNCRGWRRSSQVSMSVAELVARDGDACSLCGDILDLSIRWPAPYAPTVDHVVPGSLGGTGEPGNLAAAHFRCNSTKQSRVGWKPAV